MKRPAHPTIALLQSSSLTSLVQQDIERRILQGELPPGAKLIEAELAADLGVSRGPVREAFRMLEEAGLVRQEKNRGVFVRNIPLGEAVEIFDLRVMMDEAVGRQLAQCISPEQLKAVRAMVDAMEKAVKAGDTDAYHLLNLDFHDKLVEFAGNRKLTALYRRLMNELSLFRRLNLVDGRLMPVTAGEHRALVKAIASGDADAAARALREHALLSKQRTFGAGAVSTPAAVALPGGATVQAALPRQAVPAKPPKPPKLPKLAKAAKAPLAPPTPARPLEKTSVR